MRGEIITIDTLSGDGLISGDDGQRYSFISTASRSVLRVGDKVDFAQVDGTATDIMVLASAASAGVGVAGGYTQPNGGYDFTTAMFKFDGRLRRSHFWISWAILFVGGFVVGLIPFIGGFIGLAAIWPQIAIQVKRLHDMGRSGWWVLAQIGANIALTVIAFISMMGNFMANAQAIENEDPAAIMALLGSIGFVVLLFFVVNIGWLLWIGIADSKPGRNIYGPNPKTPVDDTANTFA